MPDYGIKVMRAGYSVTESVSPPAQIKKFALLSSANLLKIKQNGRLSLNSGASIVIPHGLSYKPLFWVFVSRGGDLYPVYYEIGGTFAYVDPTNLVIENQDGSTRDFYYYIFHDPV